uniref:Uncharacterized protein n=1 Tax=Lepeophtheirus salmonis TaxID=72036 RepID=A0A0K2VKD3_LEPSM
MDLKRRYQMDLKKQKIVGPCKK